MRGKNETGRGKGEARERQGRRQREEKRGGKGRRQREEAKGGGKWRRQREDTKGGSSQLTFFSKIRELEKEKLVEEDCQVLKSQLESEILNLKTQNLTSMQKFKYQISALERSKKDRAPLVGGSFLCWYKSWYWLLLVGTPPGTY